MKDFLIYIGIVLAGMLIVFLLYEFTFSLMTAKSPKAGWSDVQVFGKNINTKTIE